MSWYTTLKTAAPYTENICPVCTTTLLIDFWHEKGPKYAKAPYAVGECPQCGAAIKVQAAPTEETVGFNYSAAVEITRKQLLDDVRSGIPVVLVVKEEDTPIGATSVHTTASKVRRGK